MTIPPPFTDNMKADYELLCLDNTRAPIDNYKNCHLARVPAHAVVTRKDPDLTDLIWNSLNSLQVGMDSWFCKMLLCGLNLSEGPCGSSH